MNIYVGNLPLDFTDEELRQKFSVFGEVKSAVIMNDKYIGSGQSSGYGYIEMLDRVEGENAIIRLKGEKFGGSEISIMEALPVTDRKVDPAQKVTNSKWAKHKRRQRK